MFKEMTAKEQRKIIENAGNSLAAGLRAGLNIHSPNKEMNEHGEEMEKWFEAGMSSVTPEQKEAFRQMLEDAGIDLSGTESWSGGYEVKNGKISTLLVRDSTEDDQRVSEVQRGSEDKTGEDLRGSNRKVNDTDERKIPGEL